MASEDKGMAPTADLGDSMVTEVKMDENLQRDRMGAEATSSSTATNSNKLSPPDMSVPANANANTTARANERTTTNVFDTSNRKLIIYNVDKFLKPKAIEKLVQSWTKNTDILVDRKKKPPRNNWIVLTMKEESMVENMMNIINDGKHKNKKGGLLKASRPDGNDDGNGNSNKRSRQDNGNYTASKRQKDHGQQVEFVKSDDDVRDKLTPYWKLSYSEQLDSKTRNMIKLCFSRIISDMKKKFQTLRKEQKKQAQNNGCKKEVDQLYDWLKGKSVINMSDILAAPRTVEYRNKCEMTFGYRHSHELDDTGQPVMEPGVADNLSVNGNVEEAKTNGADANEKLSAEPATKQKIIKCPAVGFMAGGWAGGVSDPHCLSNVPDIVCGIADVLNNFLKSSPIPPYDSKLHRGVWRFVTIRSSERTKQCMILICHAPATGGAGKRDDGSDDYSNLWEGEKARLVKMLTDKIPCPVRTYASNVDIDVQNNNDEDGGNPKKEQLCDIPVTSMFFQEFDGLSNPKPDHPVQHAFGKQYIQEKLLKCEFQISPGAFFQVTTEGAEKLYSVVVDKVKEVTPNPKDTLLFDVCCGTGTIGLTCMKEGAVGKVVGIDISEPAIRDAVINAERNGYLPGEDEFTRFIASRAELVMGKEIHKVKKGTPMVAVVDPAREGLHQDVIKALRNQGELERIVYVSCNPTGSLVKDATLLCSPSTKKYKGLPFKITAAQPVDMFPLTDHCEMVMVFDRMTEQECRGEACGDGGCADRKKDRLPDKNQYDAKEANVATCDTVTQTTTSNENVSTDKIETI